jgi:hypothetical protein
MKKYMFEITYQTKKQKIVSELMRKLDFDCGEIAIKDTIYVSFFHTSANDPSIEKFKVDLREAFESVDCTILEIEGGCIE